MTLLSASNGMATWPPIEIWQQDSSRRSRPSCRLKAQAMPDREASEPEVQIAKGANIRNPAILRFLIKALVVLIVFTLPFVSSPVRVQDDAPVSTLTLYDQLGDVVSWSPTDDSVSRLSPSIGIMDPLYDSLERPVESADSLHWASGDAFGLPTFDYRGWASIEETGASRNVSIPVWVELPLAAFSSWIEFKLSHASSNDSLDSGSDNPKEKIHRTVPTVKVETHLARVTVYWPEEGDYNTRRRMSSTGVSLRDGHCAVDPKKIPYGSLVKIPGMGEFVAVDTGPAVVSRRAARATGRTSEQGKALVVDVYCSSRSKARVLEARAKEFAVISWYR